jgi:prepilin-type N-terminal cleavage/methylation domain-containing protein
MYKKSGGFTLIELIVVIAILSILATMAVPRLTGFKNVLENRMCYANRKTVERSYSAFLLVNDMDHTESIFNQFLIDNFDELCPAGGEMRYEDGKVKCSEHSGGSNDEDDEEDPGEEVPWL